MATRPARRLLRIAGWILAGLFVIALLLAWKAGLAGVPRVVAYYAPIFSPDGSSVVVVRRDTRAVVTGFGYEMFTPPATVRYLHDRFALLQIRLADGTITSLENLPASPLERTKTEAYHNAIFGIPDAHLRWADPAHLEYEIAVTRHATPFSRVFVTRKTWDPKTSQYVTTPPWEEAPTRMGGGSEPQQLHGDMEVIAMPGPEGAPCAVVVFRQNDAAGRALTETTACRARYPSGYTAAEFAPLSRRADIERSELVRTTYADLVEQGIRSGLSDGQARLAAGREMERLGLYPKTPKLVAAHAGCEGADPLFTITDDEFRFGLFPDIEQALDAPGEGVDTHGRYITHRDYTTSKQLNTFLDAGNLRFFVKARGRCWLLTIDK